ncbi:MAG: hypothetical protein AB7O28_06405 [Vicinamibacterales bacterium]
MRRLTAALIALLSCAAPLAAQTADGQASTTPSAIDAKALGVSLTRIQRRLAVESQARRTGRYPLKLEYFVDVYGSAPALRFFDGQDLVYGGVPGGAPTHADMLWQVTPQAFRSPRVDFLGIAAGAAKFGARKAREWNYERELAAYKKLIEAGRNVPAPQPPK